PSICNSAQGWPLRHASRFLLDCVRLYEHRLAYAADVSTRTQNSNLARSGTLMLSHDGATFLVAYHSALSLDRPHSTLADCSLPVPRGHSEHGPLSFSHFL